MANVEGATNGGSAEEPLSVIPVGVPDGAPTAARSAQPTGGRDAQP